jgi:hypothetical protein
MKFLQIIVLFSVLVVIANGGKVNWDSKGKPQIEKPTKPIKGCNQRGLSSLGEENNNSSSCSK